MKRDRHALILEELRAHAEPMTLHQLSAETAIDQTTLWRDLDGMVREGLVEREDIPIVRFPFHTPVGYKLTAKGRNEQAA